jgi:hypothetical protein
VSRQPALDDDFMDLLVELARAGADHVIVGAHALGIHGVSRATGDLDVLVRPAPANAARVFEALLRFGAPLRAHNITKEDLAREGVVYQIGLPPRRVDILTRIDGVDFEEVWAHHLQVPLGDLVVPVIGREQLVRNKRAAGRPKDLLDLLLLDEAAKKG